MTVATELELERAATRVNARPGAHAKVKLERNIAVGPKMVVSDFSFDNGLRVLLHVDDAAPVICLQTWVSVGSRHEKQGKTGISHLFEHLMFGETESYAHGAFDRMLEEAGAETNAATFLDWTHYHQNLPKDALALGIQVEAQRMGGLILRDKQVASEKEVVMNERRQRVEDDTDGSVSEILYKEAFKVHAYGIPTIGFMEDIETFTPDDCTTFYKTYYAPNNLTLVIVGDVSVEETLALVREHFGALQRADIPVEDVRPEPPQSEERRLQVEKPTPTEKIAIGYKAPALGDFDYAPLTVLNEILFGGRASRLHKALVREAEVAADVRGWVGTFRDPGLYDIGFTAREGKTLGDIMPIFEREIERAKTEPVSEEELARAIARLELGTLQGLETVSGKAEAIGFNAVTLGDPSGLFTKLEQFRRVTRGDVLRVARRYLVASQRTVVEVMPSGEVDDEDDEDEDEEAA